MSKIGLFGPKSPKLVFCIFLWSRTAYQIFLIFCSKHSLWRRKNYVFTFSFRNFRKRPFLAKIYPNLALSGYIRPEARVLKYFRQKKIVFKFEKKKFFCKKSIFCPDEYHYDSPLPTLGKALKFWKWNFLASLLKKSKFYFFRLFSWNMVSIVKFEIFGFLLFSNWPDFDQKMVKNITGVKWLKTRVYQHFCLIMS